VPLWVHFAPPARDDERTDTDDFVAGMATRLAAGEDPLSHVPQSMLEQIAASAAWSDDE
jgi:hypothetical protein